ncbi:EamA-like transporter family protein [Ruegeria halocynthiae]|uniref:EamA-like transporter family protein n=1 Tax=Ruegeria halocynthiae TaxID=985054 RepID=A0A1H2UZ54_9RHOB|nr:DMT family transporter [Ruegeria halocynthiae]SDW61330.1 EamA-like transporter family protein [Ruegeria halocynthiae]
MQSTQPTHLVAASMLMVASMAIIGVIDNFVIRLAEGIGLWQFHLSRSLLMLPLIVLLSLLGLGTLRPRRYGIVALRSVLITMSMLFYFSALALMPIAQALAGLFTSPIFVLLISVLLLKQRIGPWRIVAVVLGFSGILCVLQPDPTSFEVKTLLPVAGGFFYALGAIVTRTQCANESTVALLAALVVTLGLAGAVGLIWLALVPVGGPAGADGFAMRGWVWPMHEVLPWIVVQAVGSTVAVFMLIKAYQLGEPSYVAVFEYSVMIFGPLFAWVAFGQSIGQMQVIGIGMIAFAGVLLGSRESRISSTSYEAR